jgi:hypothetical protein
MADFLNAPLVARGALGVKWGLHWVQRIVEVRANGLLRIAAAATDVERREANDDDSDSDSDKRERREDGEESSSYWPASFSGELLQLDFGEPLYDISSGADAVTATGPAAATGTAGLDAAGGTTEATTAASRTSTATPAMSTVTAAVSTTTAATATGTGSSSSSSSGSGSGGEGRSSHSGSSGGGGGGGGGGILSSVVRDITFLRAVTTGVTEYFINVAELSLVAASVAGPSFQIIARRMHTCDADSRITTNTATRTFSFVSQQHRMQWLAVLESTGARLMDVRPPLAPAVVQSSSTSVTLDWFDWQAVEAGSSRQDEQFEVFMRVVRYEARDGASKGDTKDSSGTSTSGSAADAPTTTASNNSAADGASVAAAATAPLATAAFVTTAAAAVASSTTNAGAGPKKTGFLAAVERKRDSATAEAAQEERPAYEVPHYERPSPVVVDLNVSGTSGGDGGGSGGTSASSGAQRERVVLIVLKDWGPCEPAGPPPTAAATPVAGTPGAKHEGGTNTSSTGTTTTAAAASSTSSSSSSSSLKRCGGEGVGTRTTITGLLPDTRYQFRVRQKGYDAHKKRGWSVWGPDSEVAATLSSCEQRLLDQQRRVDDFFNHCLVPYRAVYRGESAYDKTLRVLNASINFAYNVGLPYGSYAYWAWQAVGLGRVRRSLWWFGVVGIVSRLLCGVLCHCSSGRVTCLTVGRVAGVVSCEAPAARGAILRRRLPPSHGPPTLTLRHLPIRPLNRVCCACGVRACVRACVCACVRACVCACVRLF